jgi:hypothetical protein
MLDMNTDPQADPGGAPSAADEARRRAEVAEARRREEAMAEQIRVAAALLRDGTDASGEPLDEEQRKLLEAWHRTLLQRFVRVWLAPPPDRVSLKALVHAATMSDVAMGTPELPSDTAEQVLRTAEAVGAVPLSVQEMRLEAAVRRMLADRMPRFENGDVVLELLNKAPEARKAMTRLRVMSAAAAPQPAQPRRAAPAPAPRQEAPPPVAGAAADDALPSADAEAAVVAANVQEALRTSVLHFGGARGERAAPPGPRSPAPDQRPAAAG